MSSLNFCPGAEIRQRMLDVKDAIAKKKLEIAKRAQAAMMLSSVLQGWAVELPQFLVIQAKTNLSK